MTTQQALNMLVSAEKYLYASRHMMIVSSFVTVTQQQRLMRDVSDSTATLCTLSCDLIHHSTPMVSNSKATKYASKWDLIQQAFTY